MKMKATIEVEFEAKEKAPENVLQAALQRGISGLVTGIEHGMGAGSTGIISQSTKVDVLKKTVV